MKIFFEMKTQSIFELRDARKLIGQGKRILFTTGVIDKAAKALEGDSTAVTSSSKGIEEGMMEK